MEWVTLTSAVFAQGPDHELEKGWMSIDDAKNKCKGYGTKAIGVCVQGGGSDDQSYCVIAAKGTPKYSDERFYALVFKNKLPTAEEVDLFEDNFAYTTESGYDGEWARPGRGEGLGDEFQNISLFTGISPADIHQGAIGDCWLVSAFAAMAEFPDALEGLFSPQGVAPDGKYTVKLFSFAQNQWVNYEVDDRLPEEGGRTPYCALTEDGEIWPPLLEKAFAMYSEGFPELDGGQPIFALGAMTGCTDMTAIMKGDDGDTWMICVPKPTTNHVHDMGGMEVEQSGVQPGELLSMLAGFDQKNYVMCCGSTQGANDTQLVDGIHQSHAYSLISVVPNCAGSGFNMMCIRNPHGQSEWNGDWSDESELWDDYPAVAEACAHEIADDGLFWMTFEDFCTHYASVNVLKKSMQANRGKKTIANTKAMNADAAFSSGGDGKKGLGGGGRIKAQRISPAMEKKRQAAEACGIPQCAGDGCVVM